MSHEVAPNATWKELDGSIVVVNTVSGAYYCLNESAAVIWQDVAAGKDNNSIIEHLSGVYEVDPTMVAADLQKSIDYWIQENLIVAKDA
ncbi:PqqD family protein [bacterium]|nr:PqqD family protein [bacterium]